MKELLIRFVIDNATTLIGGAFVFTSAVLVPFALWAHRRVRASIIAEAERADSAQDARNFGSFAAIDVRFERLEQGQRAMTEDIVELKADTKEIRTEQTKQGERLAVIGANVDLILTSLNGAVRRRGHDAKS